MAIRSILAGAARTSTRAGVRAALLPKAPPSQICGAHLMPATPSKAPASPCIGLATKIYGAKLMPAMPSKAQAVAASLRSGVAPQVGGADLMPAMPSKAPVVGAGGSGLVAVARLPGNTAATTQAIAGRFNPAHSGVTGATMISLTPGTTVVLSWIAGSRAKPVLAVIPSAARASYYTTSKAAAGGTPGTSWAWHVVGVEIVCREGPVYLDKGTSSCWKTWPWALELFTCSMRHWWRGNCTLVFCSRNKKGE